LLPAVARRRCDLLNSEANIEPLLRTIAGVAADGAVLLFVDSVRTPASDKVRLRLRLRRLAGCRIVMLP
jgi:hypothetical protein